MERVNKLLARFEDQYIYVPYTMTALHDLVLCQTASVLSALHNIAVVLVSVLHIG